MLTLSNRFSVTVGLYIVNEQCIFQALLVYWTTSNFVTLTQVAILRIPTVREYFKIEKKIKHDVGKLPIKDKGFVKNIKDCKYIWMHMNFIHYGKSNHPVKIFFGRLVFFYRINVDFLESKWWMNLRLFGTTGFEDQIIEHCIEKDSKHFPMLLAEQPRIQQS